MIYNEKSWEGLIPFVEERLRMSRQPGSSFTPVPEIIGVFGMYSDNVVREVINHVRTPCHYLGHIESLFWDVYSHIAAALYNHYEKNLIILNSSTSIDERRNFLEKVTLVNRVALEDINVDSCNLLQSSTYRQILDQYIREALEVYKNAWRMSEEMKFLIWLDFGAEPLEYNTLKKLYNIQSPNLVIIVSSLLKLDDNAKIISERYNGSGRMLIKKVIPYIFEYDKPEE